MPDFIDNLRNNINSNINDKITVRTGEITAVNDDGTYDVKIAQSDSAYPDVETIDYNAQFSKGEIVDIIFEYGNKESPKIVGTAKKIAQDPKEVEVDYSGDGGKQTEVVTVYSDIAKNMTSWYEEDPPPEQGGQAAEEMYLIVHHKTEGNLLDNNGLAIGQYQYRWELPTRIGFCLYRCFLFFDLSSIPENAKVISAILSVYVVTDGDISEQDFYVVIQDGQPNYPHNPAVNGDYYYQNYKNNGGQVTTLGLSENAYTNISLNTNGKNWLNMENLTKLCLRSSKDIAGIMPIYLSDEFIIIDNSDYPPKLTITYEI
jgi:hypothetical protein